jgi:serine phosphatase RsbU (regulator of sigma subunit)/anti-sigma regulatory factor (Ser/Thr protein kinase)
MFRNVKKEEIAIPAQMSYMGQVRDFIEHIGAKYKYSDKIINSYKLVIEEACTNIIRHGYRDIKGGEISIKAIIRQQSLTIVILDQGISYDPRQAQTPDLEKYIQIGKKGGLGIFMMRKLMDDVQYNITSRGNELRLTKQREEVDISPFRSRWESLSMRTRYTIRASAIIATIACAIFFYLYSQVDQNTFDETVDIARSQVISLADNSREFILDDKQYLLFELAKNYKDSYPGLIHDAFIVDTTGKIIASSTPMKAAGRYNYPEERSTVEDSLESITIYQYINADTTEIYDFVSTIYAGMRGESQIIGVAHLWVTTDHIESRASADKLSIILLVLVLIAISFVGTYFLIDRIVTPFHSLADWVRQVGQGTVDEDEIDIDASDELGEIAQAFNMMTNKFREAQVSVIEQQRLQKELQVAQEIQQMLLPSDFPHVKGYDLASFYEAAKEVGGDLFDFVEVDKDTIGICVADVAGKGVPGSLIMTMIRTALRLEARGNKNPADVLSRVNRFVTDDMKRGMFVTMFYMVLDSRKRIIHYASAGHNPMILYRGSSKQTYFLNPSGFPVGIQLPDISLFEQKIEQDSIRLHEDDLLVLYTDGITEAMNPKRELYREERFLEAVRGNAQYDVSDFITNVKDDIKNHTQNYPQNDDITFVAVKEKLMQGEVLFNIQKELFGLIDEGKMTVKEACEKMQVSPYMYRKYKKVKDSVGLEGLKDLLYSSDYIEKKHLSIEVKTRLYDVISNHPEYGPKKISAELKTEKYGNTILEEGRIYNELVKAKLNTKEKRENYIKRGGKKRIKLPGTPLLTLDGQVILDYESAEKVIADKTGVEAPSDFQPTMPKTPKAPTERHFSSTKPEEKDLEAEEKVSADEELKEDKTEVSQDEVETKEAETTDVEEIVTDSEETTKTEDESEKAIEEEIREEVVEDVVDDTEKKEEPEVAAEPPVTEVVDQFAEEEKEEEKPEEDDKKFVIDLDALDRVMEQKPEAETKAEEKKEDKSEDAKTETLDLDILKEKEEEKPEEPATPALAESDEPEAKPEKTKKKGKSKKGKAKKEKPVELPGFTAEEIAQLKADKDAVLKEMGGKKRREKPREDTVKKKVEADKAKPIPTFDRPDDKISEKRINHFYTIISDDIEKIQTIVDGWGNGKIQTKDLLKIGTILGMISTNPLLKSLGRVEQIFVQVIRYFEFLETHDGDLDTKMIRRNSKDMLKYIEKENILSNSDKILEQINELGIKNHQFKTKLTGKKPGKDSQMDAIRKKIAKKNVIKNENILNNMAKTNKR